MKNDTDIPVPDLSSNAEPAPSRNPRIPAPKGIVTITFVNPLHLAQASFKNRILVLDSTGHPKGWV
jgi:hypothetical protein